MKKATLDILRRLSGASRSKASVTARAPKLQLNNLEDRSVPATFTVSNINDTGAGSLRDAIVQANAAVGADTIVFDSSFNTAQTISLQSVLPTITGDLAINGPGSNLLTVTRGSATAFRIFTSTAISTSFTGMRITNGSSTADGGGINIGTTGAQLTLDGVILSGNTATGVNGGGIRMPTTGFLTLRNSTISGNTAGSDGGAVYFFSGGSLVMENSTISGNTATGGGGGIYFFSTATSGNTPVGFTDGTLTIRNSTISGNTAGALGGGIWLPSFNGILDVTNSTFAGNTGTSGGAISHNSGGGSIVLTNTTISGNTATATGTTAGGGGIARQTTTAGSITLRNSIVAGNLNPGAGVRPDIAVGASGTTINANFSAIGDTTGLTLSGTSGNNIAPGTSLNLGSLANNGGTVQTMLPAAGSPLLNVGSNAFVAATTFSDNRGPSYPRVSSGTVDIGAVEVVPTGVPTAGAFASNITTAGATTVTFTVTYNDFSGATPGIDTSSIIGNNAAVRVTGPNGLNVLATYVSIDNATNGAPRTATYSFAAPGGSIDGVDTGTYTISLEINAVKDIENNAIAAGTIGSFDVSIANFTVLNTNDSGPGSLRNALKYANYNGTADTITFDPTVFSTPRTISFLSITPQILAAGGPLTITGPGASQLTVRRDPGAATTFRVFDSLSPTLTMSGFTVSGGNVAADGAGLQASGNILLDGMVFTGNQTTGAFDGGAIRVNAAGTLFVRNSTITGNTAGQSGGGIYFASGGSLVVESSTISGNLANGAATTNGGAGINFRGTVTASPPTGFTANTLLIRNSTISGNVAASQGGGIFLDTTFTGSLQVANSTIANNTAGQSGGGVHLVTGGGSILVDNSTISGNTSSASGANAGGGGIARTSTTAGSVTIRNSVVSGNLNPGAGVRPDIAVGASGTTLNANFSALGDTTGLTLSGTSGNNITGAGINLGPLQDNGGPTFTMLPGAGSTLIDAGSNALIFPGLLNDQRGPGLQRTFNSGSPNVDIGSVEVQPVGIPSAVGTAPTVSVAGATTHTITVVYADLTGTNKGIDVSSVIGNNNAIRVTGPNGFDVPATYVSISAGTNGTPRTATYTITAPGGAFDGFDNGTYSIVVQANQVKDIDNTFVPAGTVGTFDVLIPFYTVLNANDSGGGSLRQAILFANADTGANTITFDPTFFSTPRTISLLTPLPIFSATAGDITITGPGAALATVRRDPGAASTFRVIDSLAPNVTMTGLTITGGNIAGDGAGIQASGNIFLTDMAITGNTATGANDGGGIRVNGGGNLLLRNSVVSGNTAGKAGGGIYFVINGSLLMESSTISGNVSQTAGATYGGGGINFYGVPSAAPPVGFTPNALVIRNSTISGNTTGGQGGGLFIETFSGALRLENTTIANNTATLSGGGIHHTSGAGNLEVFGSTIVGNSAVQTGTNLGGGGIARTTTAGGSLTIRNSVVAGNTNPSGTSPDIVTGASGTTLNVNYSAIGDTTGLTLSGTSGNNIAPGTTLNLGALANNGGLTQSMLPASNSPLINAGSNDLIPFSSFSDQRGLGYVRSYADSGPAITDIGAIEVQTVGAPVAAGTGANITAAGATTYTFSVAWSDPFGSPNGVLASSINGNSTALRIIGPNGFDAPVTFVSIDSTSDGLTRTATYSFTPPGGSWDALDFGEYRFVVQASQVQDLEGNFVGTNTVGGFTVDIPFFTVINANDSGFGSLRNAIIGANADPAPNTITFDPVFFSTPQTITLLTALPTIAAAGGNLTINGPGANLATVARSSTAGDFRVFDSTVPTLTMRGLTVSGGRSTTSDGGGISTSAALVLENMVVSNNTTVGGFDGGGINILSGGSLTIRNSTVTGNVSGKNGGGIYFFSGGSLLMENTTVSNNDATGNAGGIYFFGTATSFIVRNSTINNNDALAGDGGGVRLPSFGGTAQFINTTIAANTASTHGGGISQDSGAGSISVRNSTIIGNSAAATGANAGGGGIARTSATAGSLTIANSIIADNLNPSGSNPQIAVGATGTTTTINSSAIETTGITFTGTGNIAGTGLNLGALANNGGPTQTFLPATGSPVINAGSNALIPVGVNADQRGDYGVRIWDTTVDIGAVEVQPPNVGILQPITQADPTNVASIEFTVVFSNPVTGFDETDIVFTGSTAGGTLVAAVSGTGPTYTVTVTGMTSTGTVVISIPAGAAVDSLGAGNTPSVNVDNTVTYDITAPTVTVNQGSTQLDPTAGSTIVFDVLFDEPVSGFTGSDVSFTGSTVGGTLSAVVTGTGPAYTITVSGMVGAGTVVASIPAGTYTDLAGNSGGASTHTDNEVTFDGIDPTATLEQGATQADPTTTGPVVFDVVFSEPVLGFDGSDISFVGSTVGGTLSASVTGSGTTYTVSVTGMTGIGNVVANIIGGSYTDLYGNAGDSSTSVDNVVLFSDKPEVTIEQGSTQPDPINAGPVVFDVVFTEPVTDFTDSDVSFAGSTVPGILAATVTGSGSTYTISVTGFTGDGDIVVSLPANAVMDLVGNFNNASTSVDNTVTIDQTLPTVTVDKTAGQDDPTVDGTISFDVEFSEPVTGFDATDISFAGSTSAGMSAVVTGSGTSYTVVVTGMTQTGTVVVSVPAGSASDEATNLNTASGAIDNEVQFNYGGDVQFTATTFNVNENVATINVTVSRTNGSTGALSVDYATSNGSALAGLDYVANSGTLNWADGDAADKVITITITDDRLIEGLQDFSLTLSNVVNNDATSTIGTQASTTVQIADIEEGDFNFSQPVFNVTESGVTATITVTRTAGTSGAVSVNYATADDTAHSGGAALTGQADYTPTSGTLNWADGDATPQTFTISILEDAFNEGKEFVNLTLSGQTNGTVLGANATAKAAILPSDGKVLGTMTDADGDTGRITLTGGGTGLYFLHDPDGDSKGPIDLIELTGSDPLKSILTVTTTKLRGSTGPDNGKLGIGGITGQGLKTLTARTSPLTGDGINMTGFVGTLNLSDVLNGADITIGGLPTQRTALNAAVIGDGTAITSGAGLRTISTTSIGAGTITAPNIGTLTTRGNTRIANVGNMASDITVSGAGMGLPVPVNTPSIATISVAGSIPAGADIVAPSLGGITVKKDMSGDITLSGTGIAVGKNVLRSVSVTGSILGSDIAVTGQMGTLSATQFVGGSLTAANATSITTRGNTKALIAGDLSAPITLTGAGLPAAKLAINSISVAGSMLGTADVTAPSVGSFTVRRDMLADINLSGTGIATGKPVLGVTRVTGFIQGSNIDVTGHVTSLTAGAFNSGSFDANSIGTITINGNVSRAIVGNLAAPITLSGVGVAAGKFSATSLSVSGSVQVGGNITAPAIGSITVTQDFLANLNLSGVGILPLKNVLNTLTVKRTVQGANLNVDGQVGSVSVQNFRDSNLFVGYTGPVDGSGTFDSFGTLTKFTTTGLTDSFQNSNVIAVNVGDVTLRSIDTTNPTKFGVIGGDFIKTVKSTTPVFAYNVLGSGTQGVGDFEVKLV